MAESLLLPRTRPLGLSISGEDNQNLRRLRRCRLALTAIDGTHSPLLELLLPVSFERPSVLHGLLSLSVRHTQRSLRDFDHYQIALLELSSEIGSMGTQAFDHRRGELALAASFLLFLFTRPWCDDCWVQHVYGMTAVIRLADLNIMRSSVLGSYLMGSCALQDISAFAVGTRRLSQHAWLSWVAHRPAQRPEDGGFTALEAVGGYPESLITLIAYVAEYVENEAFRRLRRQVNDFSSSATSETSRDASSSTLGLLDPLHPFAVSPSAPSDDRSTTGRDELELSLASWTYPSLPPSISPMLALGLHTAWETLRLATQIYLWRGGFHANLFEQFPIAKEQRKHSYVDKVLSNISMLMTMAQQQGLSIANAMLWPLVVVSCEGGSDKARDEKLIFLLDGLVSLFAMDHVVHVKGIVQKLWDRMRLGAAQDQQYQAPKPYISLELVAEESNLVISIV